MVIASRKRHKHRRNAPRHGSLGEQVLSHAQAGREIVQDFVPLADEPRVGIGRGIPTAPGEQGVSFGCFAGAIYREQRWALLRNAADVFFASLVAADKLGQLERDIVVLELGIGVGLFARYFLDCMRDLCRLHKKDYYDRLCYIAADRSERMLQDVLRHGVLAEHPGRYRVRQLDAMRPETLLAEFGTTESPRIQRPIRAVFLNYLLDCLPAAVLAFDGDAVRQLCVRTCVARNVRLADYTDLTPQQLRERAKSDDPRVREELLEVYGLFASEYDYQPIHGGPLAPRADSAESGGGGVGSGEGPSARGASGPPYADFALSFGRRISKRLLHSYGAIQCLEKLLGMLADGGFILVNDYGQTLTPREDEFEHQRFSLATFVGINGEGSRELQGGLNRQ